VSTFKGALNRYPKIPFVNTFEISFFVSVEYDEIRCRGVVVKRGNISSKKNTCDPIVTVFKLLSKQILQQMNILNRYFGLSAEK
jgi:hypothetical protein